MRSAALWTLTLLLPALPSWSASGESLPLSRLELLGAASLPTGLRFEETEVGGLSAITYDAASDLFYAVSDDSDADPEGRGPARFYSLRIDLSDGRLDDGDLRVVGVTEIRDEGGGRIPPSTVDLEGIARTPAGTLLITSEGQADRGVSPFLREIAADGQPLRSFPLPPYYRPQPDRGSGVRFNQAFEPLALTPGGATLFTATENALAQDGPAAAPGVRSPARILRYDLASGRLTGEFLYWTEPVAAPAVPPGGLETNGLVELLALDEGTLLALERSFSAGVGFSVRLYRISLGGAEDLLGRDRLQDATVVRPVSKTLLLDLADTGVPLDNLEGLSWGPPLADGRRSLVVVADNNFNPREHTLVLAFAASGEAVTLPGIQGRAHRSPWEGQWVFGAEGVVTAVLDPPPLGDAVRDARARRGFFLQDPEGDGDPATSDALFVASDHPSSVAPGDRVGVSGRVEEVTGRRGELPVTQLRVTPGSGVRHLGSGEPLPAPVRVGTLPGAPRRAPVIGFDDDGLEHVDPATDGLDFWESLEGMSIEIDDAMVVGPSGGSGQVVVVPDGGAGSTLRTRRGGVLLAPAEVHPERLVVEPLPGLPEAPPKVPGTSPGTSPNVSGTSITKVPGTWDELSGLDVGDRFTGPLTGVLHYSSSNYRLLLTETPPQVARLGPPADPTALTAAHGWLTVATWNVWNLDPTDGPERFTRAAERIVRELGAPAVVALQEMQDGDGPADDGLVDGAPTFETLVAAIAAAGGPRYVFRQIDPLDGLEGGEPGGNIRVGFLLDPERVEPADRGDAGALVATGVESSTGGPRLTLSPGRVTPLDPAFAGDRRRGWGSSRRPLALEVRFEGETVFLIANHFASKGRDDRLAGERQPPLPVSEDQRSHQARLVAGLVEEILALDPQAAVIVLGDLNEHEFRPPVRRLEAAGLLDLVARLPREDRYTYNFEGNSLVLDHILVSPRLARGAEIDVIHTDADAAYPRRASDHDAVVVRLRIRPENQ